MATRWLFALITSRLESLPHRHCLYLSKAIWSSIRANCEAAFIHGSGVSRQSVYRLDLQLELS